MNVISKKDLVVQRTRLSWILMKELLERKIGIRQSVAIKPAGVWKLLDGRIIEKMALIW